MNRKIKFIRALANALGLAALGFVLSTNALADKYRVKVQRVSSDTATGDIIIRVVPGTNENDFSGKALVMLLGNDPGTNRAMATLLTAVSMNAEIVIDVLNPPSFGDIQVIANMTLIAP